MKEGLKILSVYHVADDQEDDCKVTISPASVKMVCSRDVNVRDRELKQITVHFMDGDVTAFNISGLDLMTLEEVVAGYSDGF